MTLRKFIAPRRQGREEKNYFSELGVLCVFARGMSFSRLPSRISWLGLTPEAINFPPVHYSNVPFSKIASRDHAALEHFVGDGTGDAVEELRAHLWVLAQHLDRFLL
jgi:hypothetical protein